MLKNTLKASLPCSKAVVLIEKAPSAQKNHISLICLRKINKKVNLVHKVVCIALGDEFLDLFI